MFKRIIWYGIIVISAFSLIFISAGFFKAMQFATGDIIAVNNSVTQDTSSLNGKKATKDSNTVRILIVGDSIARGTGDEKSKGIGGYLPEFLKNQTAKDIVVDNAAIDGYKIADLLQQIKSGKLDNAIKVADFVVLSVGGNDLRDIQSLKDITKEEAFNTKQESYLSALKEVIGKIRSINSNAAMISVGLYNPYGVEGPSDNARLISTWNYNTQLIFEEDVRAVFISTYELFKFNLDRFIAHDKLHPSSTGYQTISYLISKAVESTLNER